MPTISVIVPVYKVEAYLDRCVGSILGQSFRDFELILVDDGSPDNCGAICDGYAVRDSRVHVIHQENGGLSAARNAGIDWVMANSDSQWLTFIDSDDWVHGQYLELLYSAVTKSNVKMSLCRYRQTDRKSDDKTVSLGANMCVEAAQVYVDYYELCMSAWCKLTRRELYENIRFPVGKLHEDAYITHILTFQAGEVAIVPEELYYYFYNPDSITRATWTSRRMDGLEAHEQRLAFFLERKEEDCYNKELAKTVEFLTENLRILMELYDSGDLYREYFHILREKTQQYYAEAIKRGAMPRNRETMWSWMFAVRPEWIWKSACTMRKLYRKLK